MKTPRKIGQKHAQKRARPPLPAGKAISGEEPFRLLIESIKDYAIFVLDPSGNVASWNPGAERIKGYKASEILGRHFSCFYPPEDIQSGKPERELLIATSQGRYEEEGWRVRKDGSKLWASVVLTAIRDENGNLCGFAKVTRDVTERRRAEDLLHESEDRHRKLFENNPHPTWAFDRETLQFLAVNGAAVRNYGYSEDEFLRMTIKDIRPLEDIPRVVESVHRIQDGAGSTGVWRHRLKNGEIIDVEITSYALNFSGRPAEVVVAVDITQRLRNEEEKRRLIERLAAANQQLEVRNREVERASQFKDQFLSTMSHELRTPLNAVLGFSELLTDARYGPLTERQSRYVNHIHSSGQHLLRLINDILDLSKIEAGRFQLNIERVAVDMSFAEVCESLQPLADKSGHQLIQHAASGLVVQADGMRFKQMLMNLLGNAIKFTPKGGKIELAARQAGEMVRIEVRDSGPGIPPDEKERIFEAFHRVRQSDKAAEGTGLGLAITRKLAELHGGQLDVESQPEGGSCFYFTVPSALTTQVEIDLVRTASAASKATRILVIEDDPSAADLLESQLSSAGYEVAVCNQPQRAIEMANQWQPSVITLDVIMVPVNGWDILSKLKSDPGTAPISVIMVSIMDQRSAGTLFGADEYVVKPVDKSILLGAVERCLSRRNSSGAQRSILVVEDDAPTREFIVDMLSREGYLVSSAADGPQAMTSVQSSLPDLVILDLILPEINGFSLIATWRKDPVTADLPIFVLTNKDLTDDEKGYLRANTKLFISKHDQWRHELIRQIDRVRRPVSPSAEA